MDWPKLKLIKNNFADTLIDSVNFSFAYSLFTSIFTFMFVGNTACTLYIYSTQWTNQNDAMNQTVFCCPESENHCLIYWLLNANKWNRHMWRTEYRARSTAQEKERWKNYNVCRICAFNNNQCSIYRNKCWPLTVLHYNNWPLLLLLLLLFLSVHINAHTENSKSIFNICTHYRMLNA